MSNELTTTEAIQPSIFQVPDPLQQELKLAVEAAATLDELVDPPSVEKARAVNVRLNRGIKKVDDERLAFGRKCDALKKRAKEYMDHLCKEAIETRTVIDTALMEYAQAVEADRLRREAQAKEAEAAQVQAEQAAGTEHMTAPLVALEAVPDVAAVPTIQVPHLVIDNEALIPRAFLKVDEKALMAALIENKALEALYGAHVTYETRLVRR